MFFYILFVPSIIILLVTMFELLIVRKHDSVLYQYCQLRRNILGYLRTKGTRLSEPDYVLANQMLDYVGITIHDFHKLKEEVFNVRKARKLAKASWRVHTKRDIFAETSNKQLKNLQNQFRFLILISIFAYTPFLKSEVVLRLLYQLAKFIAKLGWQVGKKSLVFFDGLRKDIKWLKEPNHQYDLLNKKSYC
jgi:hypothetical protein